jgi:hypothetical protein
MMLFLNYKVILKVPADLLGLGVPLVNASNTTRLYLALKY